jgi:hypothetical protein
MAAVGAHELNTNHGSERRPSPARNGGAISSGSISYNTSRAELRDVDVCAFFAIPGRVNAIYASQPSGRRQLRPMHMRGRARRPGRRPCRRPGSRRGTGSRSSGGGSGSAGDGSGDDGPSSHSGAFCGRRCSSWPTGPVAVTRPVCPPTRPVSSNRRAPCHARSCERPVRSGSGRSCVIGPSSDPGSPRRHAGRRSADLAERALFLQTAVSSTGALS